MATLELTTHGHYWVSENIHSGLHPVPTLRTSFLQSWSSLETPSKTHPKVLPTDALGIFFNPIKLAVKINYHIGSVIFLYCFLAAHYVAILQFIQALWMAIECVPTQLFTNDGWALFLSSIPGFWLFICLYYLCVWCMLHTYAQACSMKHKGQPWVLVLAF